MPTMHKRQNRETGRWTKLLHLVSAAYDRVRGQSVAQAAIRRAQRSVDRKIQNARKSGSRRP